MRDKLDTIFGIIFILGIIGVVVSLTIIAITFLDKDTSLWKGVAAVSSMMIAAVLIYSQFSRDDEEVNRDDH